MPKYDDFMTEERRSSRPSSVIVSDLIERLPVFVAIRKSFDHLESRMAQTEKRLSEVARVLDSVRESTARVLRAIEKR